MSGKLRLKVGPIEIEYDGDIRGANADVMALVEAAADVYRRKGLANGDRVPRTIDVPPETGRLRISGSAASIASRLNCISGPELIIAAAAWLTFVEGEEWFEATQLLAVMKQASAHYALGYEDTLADDIRGLVRSGKLEEISEDLYTLSAMMRRQLQQTLAE